MRLGVAVKRHGTKLAKQLLPTALQRVIKCYLTRRLTFDLKAIPVGSKSATPSPQIGYRRRAICVSHVAPFPPRAGVEYRLHRLLTWLTSQDWELLVVICPHPGRMPSDEDLSRMAAVYPNLIICDRDGKLHYHMRDGGRLLKSVRRGGKRTLAAFYDFENNDPQSMQLIRNVRMFCPDVLVELLLRLQDSFRPNLLLVEYVFMAPLFALSRPGITKVIDTIDIFSNRPTDGGQLSATDGLAMSENQEAALLRRADILIGIQPEETQDLARLAPDRKAITAGVDFLIFNQEDILRPRPMVLLVGYSNPMNVKGARDFLSFVWPTVRRELPDAEFWIAGAVGNAIDRTFDGVRVLGIVDDLGSLYAQTRVVINPAIAGTGRALKIKTVEALCHLRPVVCWPSGADGVVPAGRPFCHVASDWSSFTEHVTRLLRSDAGVLAVEESREQLKYAFSPEAVYADLYEALHWIE